MVQAAELNIEFGTASVTLDEVMLESKTYTNVTFILKDVLVGNDGIGHYECHGARGFDRGHDFIEEFDIESILVDDKEIPFSKEIYEDEKLMVRISDTLSELL